ncbi:Rap1-interacting factor 1 N terminal-domain-containing protein [Entophlyctis helioformis]|nr:Rap1-interacting factor 1 N terminal-domain-containing protein [Entophlyctis helioformis]
MPGDVDVLQSGLGSDEERSNAWNSMLAKLRAAHTFHRARSSTDAHQAGIAVNESRSSAPSGAGSDTDSADADNTDSGLVACGADLEAATSAGEHRAEEEPQASAQLLNPAQLVDAWKADLLRPSEQAITTAARCGSAVANSNANQSLECSALACLSATLFHHDHVRAFSAEQLEMLLDILLAVIDGADRVYSLETCRLAVWTISSQQIHLAHVMDSKAQSLVVSLVGCFRLGNTALTEEVLRALSRLSAQSPVVARRASLWFAAVLDQLFSRDVAVRKAADAFLSLLAPALLKGNDLQELSTMTDAGNGPANPKSVPSTASAQAIQQPRTPPPRGTIGGSQAAATQQYTSTPPPPPKRDANSTSPIMQQFVSMLESRTSDNLNMMCAWSHVVVAFGSCLHKTPVLPILLSIIETNFNSPRPGQRIGAFRAWRRLILNFSLEGHLFYSKRFKLVLIPIWNCMRFEKSHAVRQAGFETFMYLLLHLCQRDTPVVKFLDLCVRPALQYDRSDDGLHIILMAAIANMVSAPTNQASQASICSMLEESAEVICAGIQGNMPPAQWTESDFSIILECLLSSGTRIEHEQEACRQIWEQACVYIQAAWDAGSAFAHNTLAQVMDFVRHLAAQPQAVRLSLDVFLPTFSLATRPFAQEDIDSVVDAVKTGQQVLDLLEPGSSAHRSWVAILGGALEQSRDLGLPVALKNALETAVAEGLAAILSTEASGLNWQGDADANNDGMPHADEHSFLVSAEHYSAQPSLPAEGDDAAIAADADGIDMDADAAMETDENCDPQTPRRTSTAAGAKTPFMDASAGKPRLAKTTAHNGTKRSRLDADSPGHFVAHLAGLERHVHELSGMDRAHLIGVQAELARLISVCCEHLSALE